MRRFIAGAVCPACRAVDRIMVESGVADPVRTCVACGHSEALSAASAPLPATRFTTRAHEPTEVQSVRIVMPPSGDRDQSSD